MQKIGIIDCGTNTFNLLIATISDSQDYKIDFKTKYPVKLGEGGISKGHIAETAEIRAFESFALYKKILEDYDVKIVKVFATSAFRNAKNGLEVAQKVKEKFGFEIDIIDGNREAELIYKGVKMAVSMDKTKHLVMDIGGGSVEFIICNNSEIFWKQSFEIGAQRLLDNFQKNDPILSQEIEALEKYLDETLRPLMNAINKNNTEILVGASGTFDTISEIHFLSQNPNWSADETTSWQIPMEAFYHAHQLFINQNRDERLKINGMIPMRVDMIVVASCLINFIVKKLKINTIKVSSYALKEGVLKEMTSGLNFKKI